MQGIQKALLVVAVPPSVVGRFPPMLWRGSFDVITVANPRLAVRAMEQRAFSLIITSYPLPNFKFQRFLDEVRAFGSPCRKSPVIAVVTHEERDEAENFISKGLNRVVLVSDRDHHLANVIASILSVEPRIEMRCPIDIQTTLRRKGRRMMAQTINVSRSGILITDPGNIDMGDQVEFRFDIEGIDTTVAGTAEVVRVQRRRANLAQVGLRILNLNSRDEKSFFDYIESMQANAQ